MFAIQNKSFPYMFAFAVGGVFSASQVLAEELYMLCGESGGDGARFSRLCRNNSHTRRFCQFIFSKNLSTAFQNSAYNAPSVFMKDKKTFFVLELITRLTVTDQSSEREVITIMGNTVIKRHFDCLWYNDWQVSAPSSPLPSYLAPRKSPRICQEKTFKTLLTCGSKCLKLFWVCEHLNFQDGDIPYASFYIVIIPPTSNICIFVPWPATSSDINCKSPSFKLIYLNSTLQ